MVTDSGRAKVLLFGGETYACSSSPMPGAPTDCSETTPPATVWEWDGAKSTWTNRTPVTLVQTPDGFISPRLSSTRVARRCFSFPLTRPAGLVQAAPSAQTVARPSAVSGSGIPHRAGWSSRDTGDLIFSTNPTDLRQPAAPAESFTNWASDTSGVETWELDTRVQPLPTPSVPAQARATAQPWPSTASAA